MSSCNCFVDPCALSVDESCDNPDAKLGFRQKREWTRGDTIVIDWNLVDSNGAPLDLSGPTVKVWFTVKDYLSRVDSQAVWQGTYGAGVTQLSIGRARVTIPASVTSIAPDGVTKMYYDLQVKDATGQVSTIEKGIFLIDPDVTRATT